MSDYIPLYDATAEPIEVRIKPLGTGLWSIEIFTGIVTWGMGSKPPHGWTAFGSRAHAEAKAARLVEKVRRHIAQARS